MKKWIITILLAVTLLALALTTHFWGTRVIKFAVDNDKTVDSLKKLLELLTAIGGLALPVMKWLFGKKEKDSAFRSVTKSQAARDINTAGRDVQTGGARAERDLKVDGNLINQQTIINQTVTRADQTSRVDEYVPKPRVLDAAIPSHVVKDQLTEVLILVRLPDSAGLSGSLLADEDAEARPEDVRSKPFSLILPLRPDGKPDLLRVAVSLTSPDFFPPQQTKNLFVPPDADSEVLHFLLTPKRIGQLKVLIELQWEDALHGSRSLRTECVAEAENVPATSGTNVAQIGVSGSVATVSGNRPQGSAAYTRFIEKVQESLAVAEQTVQEKASAERNEYLYQAHAPLPPISSLPPFTNQVRLLRVVIASPSDVKAEREIIPRVVDEVNRNIARPRGLHLDVYRWETDSYPGFHPEGPQGLIDPTLKIEQCDILIGIFWRRFGTPVSDAKSGTEHEFRLAYEAWKKTGKPQIMVYFSQKPYAPTSKEETDQWGLVLQFKKEFPHEGLWWDYKNKAEFERLTRNHLTRFLSSAASPGRPSPEPAALSPLHQLPPPPADFTGRTTELRELRAAIEQGGIHISGLQGQGGVGKTALALKLAEDLAPNFPGAQIYLDLKGVSEKPLTAAEAMSHVLRTFHPEAKLPEKEQDLRAPYLSVLHNKRVLLLMDNAKDAAQLKSLIPPHGCMFLVTSRNHFKLPGLYQKDLNTFPPDDATKFLLEIAPRIKPEAEAIAKLCGYLALALRLAATAIAEHPDLDPGDYRQRLADEKQRLKLLGGKEDEGMEASITLSYNLLAEEKKKQWRMLSVFPDTFDTPAAAAVWEMEEDTAKQALSDLKQLSLLEWDDSTKRYRLHDLMRDFGRGRLSIDESGVAALRHARHYLEVIGTADDLYKKGGEPLMRGLALFDLEWSNIQAGQSCAAAHAESDHEAAILCSDYPDHGTYILNLRQHPREGIRWRELALAAARKSNDRSVEAAHLGNLGLAYYSLGEYRRAIEYHEQHLTIAREIGDRKGEGQALGNLGLAYHSLGEHRRAIEYHEQDLTVAREIGDRKGEGAALGNLGLAYHWLGEYRRAIEYHEQYLAIYREIGDRQGEGRALGNLGNAYNSLGEDRRAIEYHEQALAIDREIGDRRGEGDDLWNMSLALDKLGDREKALEHAEAALTLYEQIENPTAARVRKQLDIWRNG